MKTIICASLTLMGLAVVFGADRSSERSIKREKTEWCDVRIPDATDNALPRVLLIGDSISMGYYPDVAAMLKDKAYCARISTSKSVGDPALPREIATFLSESKYDVIHFNIGMHGWDYSEQEYQTYLPELLAELRKDAPGAKLIWASTTPVRKDKSPGPTNARIRDRNDIARDYFSGQGIPVDDLNTLLLDHDDLHTDDVHYKPEGYAIAAKQVTAEILEQLPAPAAER